MRKEDRLASTLIKIKFENSNRARKTHLVNPRFLFSNVCSLFNKRDELSLLLHQHQIDIGVFVESWLDNEMPDESVNIDDYYTCFVRIVFLAQEVVLCVILKSVLHQL